MAAPNVTSLNIPIPLHKQLKQIADKEGRKLQWLVVQLLTDALKARKAA